MRRIEIGEQKAYRDRFDAFRLQRPRRGKHAAFIERLKFLAMRRYQSSLHDFAMAALDQRPVLPRQFLHDRIVLDTLMTRDVDDVAEALIGEHAGASAFVLQHGIGGRGRAVQHVIDVARRDAVVAADFGDALEDTA